jgi:probable HAF family extracellular repeat protein
MRNILAVLALVAWSGCAMAQQYVVMDLGPLPTGFGAFAGKGPSINSSGQVSGWIEVGNPATSLAAIGTTDDGVTTIGTPGSAFSFATGINESGNAVGYQAVAGSTTNYHAFFYGRGSLVDMGTLGGATSDALAMSNTNFATGESLTVSGVRTAFFWNGSTMLDVQTPTGEESIGQAVSDNGYVTGLVGSPRSNGAIVNYQAFLWQNGKNMVALGGTDSVGNAVNNKGVVAGVSYYGSQYQATMWTTSGTMVDLGGNYSVANAINSAGVIAGTNNSNANEHAYVWNHGVGTDLGSLLASPGVTSTAWSIDDTGAVFGITSTNEVIEWAPVPVALAALLKKVTGVAPGSGLAIEVLIAQVLYDVHDIRATCAVLTGFVNEVHALDGKRISQTLDAQLIANASAIEVAIGCN